jgi:hypothetical protein
LLSFSIGYCLTSDCCLIIPVGIFFYWLLSDIWLWSDHPCWYLFLLVIVWHLIVVWSSLLLSFSIGYCLTSDCGLIIPVGILFLLVIVWHLIVVWSSLLISFFYWLLSDIWLWSDHPCWYLFLLVIVWHLIVVWSSLLVSFSIGYCLTSDCGLIIPVGIFFYWLLWILKWQWALTHYPFRYKTNFNKLIQSVICVPTMKTILYLSVILLLLHGTIGLRFRRRRRSVFVLR